MVGPIIFIAGARPNFMKIAPILRALEARSDAPPRRLVHTGQHYDHEMSGVFFEQLGIASPDVHLRVGSGSHAVQTGKLMESFDQFLDSEPARPRGVVVVGDVNSTLACALVAAKRQIAVAHVESGLRSFDRAMPEEINRIVTDGIADLLFVSEPSGLANLEREGVPASKIKYVGNVMIDSLVAQLEVARANGAELDLPAGDFALATIHRPSNVDDEARLVAIAAFLTDLAKQLPVVFPVHPRTRERLRASSVDTIPGVKLLQPLGYREFLGAMDRARVVVTDSGGIQEETSYLGVPCVTLRTTTERPATTTFGTNVVVGESLDVARSAVATALAGPRRRQVSIEGWDGRAGERIVDALIAAWSD
jgi:UDP-N-acetylglucosamine 2-epimerase (non-hydrolysing)